MEDTEDKYQLTKEQEDWLDARLKASSGERTLLPGEPYWHGFQGETPDLTDDRALWIAKGADIAQSYKKWGQGHRAGGVLQLTPSREFAIPELKASALDFVGRFDPGNWGIEHNHYASRLRQWGLSRGLQGVADGPSDIVIFTPKTMLDVVDVQYEPPAPPSGPVGGAADGPSGRFIL